MALKFSIIQVNNVYFDRIAYAREDWACEKINDRYLDYAR